MGLLFKVTRVPELVQALRGHILNLLYRLSVSGGLDLKHSRVPAAQCHQALVVLEHDRSCGVAWADSSYAARAACQISRIVDVLPASLPILNGLFLIFSANSIPSITNSPRIRLNVLICTRALLRRWVRAGEIMMALDADGRALS